MLKPSDSSDTTEENTSASHMTVESTKETAVVFLSDSWKKCVFSTSKGDQRKESDHQRSCCPLSLIPAESLMLKENHDSVRLCCFPSNPGLKTEETGIHYSFPTVFSLLAVAIKKELSNGMPS